MGFPPREIDAMSLWQFFACTDGYAAANGGEPSKELSDADFEAAARAYDAFPDRTT